MFDFSENIVITGSSGVGKTTIIMAVLKHFAINWGGYFTERIQEHSNVTHRMVTSDGRNEVFADQSWKHLPQFASMGVQIKVFEQLGVDILQKAQREAELIVMDELGLMEINAKNFIREVLICFDSQLPVISVMKERAKDFWNEIISRQNYRMIKVTPNNQNEILSGLIKLMEGNRSPVRI